ncbi:recombination regulator RecX [Legionella israelensis]|uniref:Regulatory protein RecX n=1 Tax=Legionella israelensis TaxID=454 RepID=A0A0W0VUA7_9GAMM|nr:recombination regulator RecX [Legionella israelensis]KTD23699.1 Regulatory protein RecX [Legionella israelensis]QBR84033.1 recombination regulator RecX [Legionella israelensis]QBS10919.1 recombination regulator RecX [Legionella israelensis]QDP72870.1 recombination regulator RecX [Legionella israelensis]SCX79917.1 regulatory protein [Legionella israelensis DSM 19235]
MIKAFDNAARLLARREHGAQELIHKLMQKGYTREEADDALAKCQHLGLQNEKRFIEAVLNLRMRQGYGPQKIKQELQSKQVDSELLDDLLLDEEMDWLGCALKVWYKKNKDIELDFVQLQKMKRFLLYRGFPSDIIQQVVCEVKPTS